MMWVRFEENKITSGPQSLLPVAESLAAEFNWYPFVSEKAPHHNMEPVLTLEDGVVTRTWAGDPDPLSVPASADEINALRRELEASPIEVFGTLIDCDEHSELLLRDTINFWDDLEAGQGAVEEQEIDGQTQKVVLWTMGDNSTQVLTKAQLEAVFTEMLRVRAIRASRLFSAARAFKADPNTTLRMVQSPENWLP